VIFLFVNAFSLAGLYRGDMLLANCIYTSLEQPLRLVAVGCLNTGKYSYVDGLELVGGVRGEVT
jgi:hypothetical protein